MADITVYFIALPLFKDFNLIFCADLYKTKTIFWLDIQKMIDYNGFSGESLARNIGVESRWARGERFGSTQSLLPKEKNWY